MLESFAAVRPWENEVVCRLALSPLPPFDFAQGGTDRSLRGVSRVLSYW